MFSKLFGTSKPKTKSEDFLEDPPQQQSAPLFGKGNKGKGKGKVSLSANASPSPLPQQTKGNKGKGKESGGDKPVPPPKMKSKAGLAPVVFPEPSNSDSDYEDEEDTIDQKKKEKEKEKDTDSKKLEAESEKKATIDAMVVTIWSGSSYDALFRHVKQEGEDGGYTAVYTCDPACLGLVVRALEMVKAKADGGDGGELDLEALCDAAPCCNLFLADINIDAGVANANSNTSQRQTQNTSKRFDRTETVRNLQVFCDQFRELDDPEAVVFNFECCSGCNDAHFSILNAEDCKEYLREYESRKTQQWEWGNNNETNTRSADGDNDADGDGKTKSDGGNKLDKGDEDGDFVICEPADAENVGNEMQDQQQEAESSQPSQSPSNTASDSILPAKKGKKTKAAKSKWDPAPQNQNQNQNKSQENQKQFTFQPTRPGAGDQRSAEALSNLVTLNWIADLIDLGVMVMCSDFSLKALLGCWHHLSERLGPNPFIKPAKGGGHSGSVKLRFHPWILKECCSAQLQSVGDLCIDKTECVVKCMGGTVVYTVDNKYLNLSDEPESDLWKSLPYSLEVLTVTDERVALPGGHKPCWINGKVPERPGNNADMDINADGDGESRKEKRKPATGDHDQQSQSEASLGMSKLTLESQTQGETEQSQDQSQTQTSAEEVNNEKQQEEEQNQNQKHKKMKEEQDDDKQKAAAAAEAEAKMAATDPSSFRGACGHAVLTYKRSGGRLLTSMTHWHELTQLGSGGGAISETQFFKVAWAQYGYDTNADFETNAAKNAAWAKKFAKMQMEYDSLSWQPEEQQRWIAETSNMMVQQRAPAQSKAKKMKILSGKNVW